MTGTNWDATEIEYSGDVTLSGDEQPPVGLSDPEDVYVLPNSIDGDLKLVNPEYVFTDMPAGDAVEIDDPETELVGSIEDGYIEPTSIDGDAIIANAGDVFIADGAVAGDLQILGDEKRFQDDDAETAPPQYEAFETTVAGWNRSQTVTDPRTGVALTGVESTVRIQDAEHSFALSVAGSNNHVRIDGRGIDVTVFLRGYDNTIEASAHTTVTVARESGYDNVIENDQFPAEDLITTTKSEAYRDAFIGRRKVTYQAPALDEEWCPGCGASADAVIERHQEDAFFLFGYPIYHFEKGDDTYECESCSVNATPETALSESERRSVLS